MKRMVFAVIASVSVVVLGVLLRSLFPRPPKEAADLIDPILYERIRADDSHHARGSPAWNLEEDLERLTKNNSAAADTASVILLDYYLGEHNGEAQICAVTSRGSRVLPLVLTYRQHPAGLLKPWYAGLRLNREERESMFEIVLDAVRNGKIVGCDE
jgi:hypothetical protein